MPFSTGESAQNLLASAANRGATHHPLVAGTAGLGLIARERERLVLLSENDLRALCDYKDRFHEFRTDWLPHEV